jgi:hypothetical protein
VAAPLPRLSLSGLDDRNGGMEPSGTSAEPELPPLPEPFAEEPPSGDAGGCGKWALVGCGVILVLLGLASILLVTKADDLLLWTLQRFEEVVHRQLPEDLPAGERKRLDDAFQAFYQAVREGHIEVGALEEVQRRLYRVAQHPERKMTREEVWGLAKALEAAAGVERQEEPTPTPTGSTSVVRTAAAPVPLAAVALPF